MNKPNHIAIIPDGNRRWARQNKLESIKGHDAWKDSVQKLFDIALHEHIPFLTIWGLSTENLSKRSESEVMHLLAIFRDIPKMFEPYKEKGIRFETIGDITAFPDDMVQSFKTLKEETKNNTTLTVTLALNYGGQAEIATAAKTCIDNKEDPSIEHLDKHMETKKLAPVDLIIRTGWDKRLSGFFLWQSAYAELYFTDTYWPDFDANEWQKALSFFANCKRNFGK